MKIIKTKDPNSIKFLVGKIQELIDKEEITEYNKSMFLKWLRQNIAFPILGLWIAIEEFESEETPTGFNVLGFVIASIHSNLMEEYVNISQLLGEEEVEKALLEKVYGWAKENGINKIMTNARHLEKWQEYGFELDYHILSKDIETEHEIIKESVVEVKEE